MEEVIAQEPSAILHNRHFLALQLSKKRGGGVQAIWTMSKYEQIFSWSCFPKHDEDSKAKAEAQYEAKLEAETKDGYNGEVLDGETENDEAETEHENTLQRQSGTQTQPYVYDMKDVQLVERWQLGTQVERQGR